MEHVRVSTERREGKGKVRSKEGRTNIGRVRQEQLQRLSIVRHTCRRMARHQHQRTPAQPPRLLVLHLHLVPIRVPRRHEAPARIILIVLLNIDAFAILRRDVAGRSGDDGYRLGGIVQRLAVVRIKESKSERVNDIVEEDQSGF